MSAAVETAVPVQEQPPHRFLDKVSAGDWLKIAGVLVAIGVGYSQLTNSQGQEAEARRALAAQLSSSVSDIQRTLADNVSRTDMHLAEAAAHQRELIADVKERMDRMDKQADHIIEQLDTLARHQ